MLLSLTEISSVNPRQAEVYRIQGNGSFLRIQNTRGGCVGLWRIGIHSFLINSSPLFGVLTPLLLLTFSIRRMTF
jgi:hypothetical protein